MPASKAMIGYGTVLEIARASAPSTWTYIAETKSHTPPSFTDSTVEVTHAQSPGRAREYIGGLSDPGESSHEMNWIPGSATDTFLRGIGGDSLIARLTFPNGCQMIYNAIRAGYETDVPLDEGIGATLTLKVSGEPTMTAVAAPRNLVAPVILGTPKVGVPLTVDPGVWAGARAITYQWQADGVDVSGATGGSLVPVTANIGDVITVVVNGANGSFDVDVESAGTAVVAA